MASSINASTSGAGGVITTADNSGILNLQSNGTTVATVSSTGFSTPANQTINTANTFSFKNRIINGGMSIDQRNAGGSITPTDGQFTVDRWQYYGSQASKFTVQQNKGSVTPPAGFINYLGASVAAAVTPGASDYFFFIQNIEGLNIADLAWGSANAKTVTVSFQVYSSLTGTFSGSLRNSGGARSYPFNYTVSVANTWTSISVTIPGDTSGTWLTTTGQGIRLSFNLGSGSNRLGTAGAWAAGDYDGATGSVSVVSTNGATFYVTGVQLEVGSQATSFDFRAWNQEMYLCERYYQTSYAYGTVPGTNLNSFNGAVGRTGLQNVTTSGELYQSTQFKQKLRASPTASFWDIQGNASKVTGTAYGAYDTSNESAIIGQLNSNGMGISKTGSGTYGGISYYYAVSAEL